MDYLERLGEFGCAIETGMLDTATTDRLAGAADLALATAGRSPPGVRDLFTVAPEFAELKTHPRVRALVEPVLGKNAFVTRSILFDKRLESNWDVAWHQDRTIAVEERREAAGFGPWSVKAGIVHVQPPQAVLDAMLTVRLHLDDCGPENGPLLVIRKSHTRLLTDREIDGAACERHPEKAMVCVPRGGAVVMRPLILHASKKATAPSRRRVVHLEFAGAPLPGGLRWARC